MKQILGVKSINLGVQNQVQNAAQAEKILDAETQLPTLEVAQDIFDGWTFDSTTNILTFHGNSIPGPGAVVTVSYERIEECGQ